MTWNLTPRFLRAAVSGQQPKTPLDPLVNKSVTAFSSEKRFSRTRSPKKQNTTYIQCPARIQHMNTRAAANAAKSPSKRLYRNP